MSQLCHNMSQLSQLQPRFRPDLPACLVDFGCHICHLLVVSECLSRFVSAPWEADLQILTTAMPLLCLLPQVLSNLGGSSGSADASPNIAICLQNAMIEWTVSVPDICLVVDHKGLLDSLALREQRLETADTHTHTHTHNHTHTHTHKKKHPHPPTHPPGTRTHTRTHTRTRAHAHTHTHRLTHSHNDPLSLSLSLSLSVSLSHI